MTRAAPPAIGAGAQLDQGAAMEGDRDYFIWSNEHRAWWRGNRLGYTQNIYEAGNYSRDEALAVCIAPGMIVDGIPQEIPVRQADIKPVYFWD